MLDNYSDVFVIYPDTKWVSRNTSKISKYFVSNNVLYTHLIHAITYITNRITSTTLIEETQYNTVRTLLSLPLH